MKNHNFAPVSAIMVVLSTFLSAVVTAEVPRKQPVGRYAELWTKSPFTVPPVEKTEVAAEENPLQDYTLGGVCAVEHGWFVVLINKKNREERIRIKPNEKNSQGFKIVNVREGAKFKETRVEVSTGSKTGWVEYDDKFLVLKRAAVTAPRPQPNGRPGPQRPGGAGPPGVPRPGGARPPVPTPNRDSARTNRVPGPPPVPGANGGTQRTRPGGSNTNSGNGRSTRGQGRDGRSRGRGR